MKPAIPILRSFDETQAKRFYVDFLEFQVDWEYRHTEGMPLYLQVSRGECILHLSEHYGDCSPAAQVCIDTPDLDEYLKTLRAKDHPNCKPGPAQKQPWGSRNATLTDPFGNRLTFYHK
ncbi:MAG: glyoxalase superfamily protein [Verrucomicrobiota bacterium]